MSFYFPFQLKQKTGNYSRQIKKEFNIEVRKMLLFVKVAFWFIQKVFSYLIKILQYQYFPLKL